jgi:hypothetical protein
VNEEDSERDRARRRRRRRRRRGFLSAQAVNKEEEVH